MNTNIFIKTTGYLVSACLLLSSSMLFASTPVHQKKEIINTKTGKKVGTIHTNYKGVNAYVGTKKTTRVGKHKGQSTRTIVTKKEGSNEVTRTKIMTHKAGKWHKKPEITQDTYKVQDKK